jgi:branched-chain amino acid aminotransferase
MTLWVDGRLIPDDAPVVRADDHGLVVGDGVFETVLVRDGVPFALTRHLRRLHRSAQGLGMQPDESVIRAGVEAVLADAPPAARLRITVTGGPSPYGSDRGNGPLTILIATGALTDWPATSDVAIVPWTRNERAATAGLKTTSYADNVVALKYAHERDAAEAIFGNSRGEVCEGTGSNVFFEHRGVLVTPPLSSGCLAGVTRELLIEWLADAGFPVDELALPLDALRTANEAFLTSTTRDVMPIGAVDGVPLADAPGPLTKRAQQIFAERAADHADP